MTPANGVTMAVVCFLDEIQHLGQKPETFHFCHFRVQAPPDGQ